jgi:hypothetical protein
MTEKWTPDAAVLAATGKQEEQPAPPLPPPAMLVVAASTSMAENIARIIHLDKQIEELEQTCAALAAERSAVAEALKEQFVEAEIQNVKVLGRTVFLHRSVYCTVPAENMQQIVKVLDAEGLGDVAPRMASTAKIKGLLKEDEAKWKAKFGELIKTGERYDIRNRSAS